MKNHGLETQIHGTLHANGQTTSTKVRRPSRKSDALRHRARYVLKQKPSEKRGKKKVRGTRMAEKNQSNQLPKVKVSLVEANLVSRRGDFNG